MKLYKFNPFFWLVFTYAKIFKRKRLLHELQKQEVQEVFCDRVYFVSSWGVSILLLLSLIGVLLFIMDEVRKWLS
jgi:hypothetical protein